jgi:hypothetical protein
MRTITVVPKIIAVDSKGSYSPYGAITLDSTIEKTSLYTWRINNYGTITYGLGRMPTNKEDAVKVAKDLEKLGYVYQGIEE